MSNLSLVPIDIKFPSVFRQIDNIAGFKSAGTNLVSNYFLNSLDLRIFNRITPFLEPVVFADDHHIYQIHSPIDFVYFPETAVFSEYKILEDGRTNETAMIGSEGIVGLSALTDPKETNYWTQVLIPGKALKLNLARLKQEIDNDCSLRAALFNYLFFYIEQISQRVICNSHHLLEERFCCWLTMIKQRCRSSLLPLTHEQISRSLGVHRPNLSQAAKSLRAKGVIDYKRGQIEIRDYQKLKILACSCFRDMANKSDAVHASSI